MRMNAEEYAALEACKALINALSDIESTHTFVYKITNSRLTALSIGKITGCTNMYIIT